MSIEDIETNLEPEASDPESQPHLVAHGTIEYQGPLPPPAILSAYDELVPGTAEMMLHEWRNDRQHQRMVRSKFAETFTTESRWTPAYRLATIIVIIAGGLLAIVLGEPAMGWFLGLSAALSYPIGSALFRILRGRARDTNSPSNQSDDS